MKLYENQYMCMKTNMHGNHNASTPGLATHQRLRDLVRMGSGSWWPGTTQVTIMIRIEISLSFGWVLCVNIAWIDVNEHHYIFVPGMGVCEKAPCKNNQMILVEGGGCTYGLTTHYIFTKLFMIQTLRSFHNSNHRRFDHITSVGASTTPANALGELVPGKIHTKKGLDFKNWDQLIRAWVQL